MDCCANYLVPGFDSVMILFPIFTRCVLTDYMIIFPIKEILEYTDQLKFNKPSQTNTQRVLDRGAPIWVITARLVKLTDLNFQYIKKNEKQTVFH